MENGQFDVNITGNGITVRRHFEIQAGTIDFAIRFAAEPDTKGELTLMQIHEKSVRIVIEHLQGMLPASSGK